MPYSKLFRSRWAALLWAAGILWTAVEIVGVAPSAPANNAAPADNAAEPADTDALGMPVNDTDLALFESVMNGN